MLVKSFYSNVAKKALVAEAISYFNQAEQKIPLYANKLEQMVQSSESLQLLHIYLNLYRSRSRAYLESKQTHLFLSDAQKVVSLSWLQEVKTSSGAKYSFKFKTSQSLIQTLTRHAEALFHKSEILLLPIALKKDEMAINRHNSFKEQELEKANDKGEDKKKTATSMLERAEFYLLYEAYWDFDYPEKVSVLKKTYRRCFKKVCKKMF